MADNTQAAQTPPQPSSSAPTPDELPRQQVAKNVVAGNRRYFFPQHGLSVLAEGIREAEAAVEKLVSGKSSDAAPAPKVTRRRRSKATGSTPTPTPESTPATPAVDDTTPDPTSTPAPDVGSDPASDTPTATPASDTPTPAVDDPTTPAPDTSTETPAPADEPSDSTSTDSEQANGVEAGDV